MEKVLDRVTMACKIEQNENGLYDLTVMEAGRVIETARNLSLKSAARIAVDKLGEDGGRNG